MPGPTEHHKILQKEVGTWTAKVTSYMGESGPLEEPDVSEGKEVNRMLGGMWLVSDFRGKLGGLQFEGHSVTGWDSKQEKYVGSWVDSFSPAAAHTLGSYDKETNTMNWEMESMGMDGNPSKSKMVVVYKDKDQRTMTMYSQVPGMEKMAKVMEIEYTRANE